MCFYHCVCQCTPSRLMTVLPAYHSIGLSLRCTAADTSPLEPPSVRCMKLCTPSTVTMTTGSVSTSGASQENWISPSKTSSGDTVGMTTPHRPHHDMVNPSSGPLMMFLAAGSPDKRTPNDFTANANSSAIVECGHGGCCSRINSLKMP